MQDSDSDSIQTRLLTVVRTNGSARCAVCGEILSTKVTSCNQCETPYHLDCFEYNAGCAIFGCKSQTARREVQPIPPSGTDTAVTRSLARSTPPPVANSGLSLALMAVGVCLGVLGSALISERNTPRMTLSWQRVQQPSPVRVEAPTVDRDAQERERHDRSWEGQRHAAETQFWKKECDRAENQFWKKE